MCRSFSGYAWIILTPDEFGSYANGTWKFAALPTSSGGITSGMFLDGSFLLYGEANSLLSETYDPVQDRWAPASPPNFVVSTGGTSDLAHVIMPDGRLMTAKGFSNGTAFYDPVTDRWTDGPNTLESSNGDHTWLVLPDGSVLSRLEKTNGTERYVPSTQSWIFSGFRSVDNLQIDSPAILLTNATALWTGMTQFCIYTMPTVVTDPGTWSLGPKAPHFGKGTMDNPEGSAAVLPNGNVLMNFAETQLSLLAHYFEYDGSDLIQVSDLPELPVGYYSNLTPLPSGEVLATLGAADAYVYTNGGGPQESWKPVVLSAPTDLKSGVEYTITGRQVNGVTNGAGRDEGYYSATNYPLVRLTNRINQRVIYARVTHVTSMGVRTGPLVSTVNFVLPNNVAGGTYDFQIVASGMASNPRTVTITETDLPTTISVNRGTLLGGELASVLASDDAYYTVKRGRVLSNSEIPLQIDVTTSTGIINPNTLKLVLEDASNKGITRKVYLFNWNTDKLELVDSRVCGPSEAVSEIITSGDLSRFVEPTLGIIRARLAYQKTGTSAYYYQAKIDALRFELN